MVIRVLFFGPAQTAAGVGACSVSLDGPGTVERLVEHLLGEYPALGGFGESLRYAVNEEFAEMTRPLSDKDEVAVIPPVSGGSDTGLGTAGECIALVDSAIDAAGVLSLVTGDGRLGGVVSFQGVTRGDSHPKHGDLVRLEYQVYDAMARRQLHGLLATAKHRWPVERAAIVHRVGPVGIGEASVLIAVACPHRAEAFKACQWLIDELKREVPIWKCEHWSDGQSTWSGPGNAIDRPEEKPTRA
ncbi:MAG: molybdenum cofactor biosynthesis protein MoaE [Planctomycetes bacterium]|nr:molybdenum cofactor biosynthesis protein MoaE [Planctomycetota bacterium]